MSVNNCQNAVCAPELLATMTASAVLIGTLIANPVHIIFDNQGTVPVAISSDGGATTWKTFTGGEAIILDMRSNHGIASNYTFRIGTQFTGTGASGNFSIAYTYAENQ